MNLQKKSVCAWAIYYKLGVTSAKSIEKLMMMKEIITWLYVRVKFLIGYTQSFVFGETLNKWTISFHSRAKTTDLNNNVETCCQDFRLLYRYRFDNRTKYVFVGGSFEHSNAESRWPMHVQDTDHSAFLTNTYSYRSHYITWSENLNFCTSNVCTFGSYIMFNTINNIPWFPVSVSRSRRIILFSVSFCSVLEGECLNIRAEHFPEWILRLVWKFERSCIFSAQAAWMYISQKLALLIRQMKVFFWHVMTGVC